MRALFLQEIKTFFRSPSSIFIFLIPLILLVGLGYFIPAAYIIPSSISVGIVGAVLLYFGGGLEEIKRTSFLKVMGTTKLNKVTILIVKMFFAALISMATVIWILGLGFLFSNVIPFLATDFGNLDESLGAIPGKVQWDEVQWVILFYAAALSLCVTLALAFCFAALAKSSLSFYLLTFGYIAALILFGGVIMPGFLLVGNNWFHWFYYLIPNYYSGNQLTAAFNSGLTKQVFKYLSIIQIVLDYLVNNVLSNKFPNFDFDVEATKLLLALQEWLQNNEGFVQIWNEMAGAVSDAKIGNVPDFSAIDGGDQISKGAGFWSGYFLGAGFAWGLGNLPSYLFDSLLALRTNALSAHDGAYWIDDLFYCLFTMPSKYLKKVDKLTGINLVTILGNIIVYGNEVFILLTSGTVETIKALIGSMEYSKAFDFTNTKSIIDVFMPYVWIAGLAGVSAWKFEWVN